nr:L,D-transpeptidase [Paracoccus aminovorans]
MRDSAGTDRRRFLMGMIAGGASLVPGLALAQQLDPATGLPVQGRAQAGQAPDIGLYQVDPNADTRRNISAFTQRHWSEFFPSLGKGVILADISSKTLNYWTADGTHRVFPCSIPVSEELTRRGKTEVVRKAENPRWTPTPDMRRRDPTLPVSVAGGDPMNPLGPRALYLSWPAYLIHGTHDTRKIGRRSSSGCYGLYNEHILSLYDTAEVGTQVAIF